VFAEKVVEERDAARQTLARIEQWARAHGAALNPHGRADTFGEGVRESKEQVQRLLKGRHDL
jgi:hypothetical protein